MSTFQTVAEAMPPEVKADIEASPQNAELLARVVSLVGGVVGPVNLRTEAVHLLATVGAKLDEADALEQRANLAVAVTEAEGALRAAEVEADRLAAVVALAVAEERDIADKYMGAQENARQCAEHAEDLALANADPAEQTHAGMAQVVAGQIAERYRAQAEQAAAQRVQADAGLAAARDVVRRSKMALTAAARVADNPPPVTASEFSLLFDGCRRVAFGQTSGWGDAEFGVVAGLVRDLARITGVDKDIRRDERTRIEQEAREKASSAFLPPPGHKARPSDPGTVFVPLPPRIGG